MYDIVSHSKDITMGRSSESAEDHTLCSIEYVLCMRFPILADVLRLIQSDSIAAAPLSHGDVTEDTAASVSIDVLYMSLLSHSSVIYLFYGSLSKV